MLSRPMTKVLSFMMGILASGAACSPGPHEVPSEAPLATDPDSPSPHPGCRFAERRLGKDEDFDTWPAPSRLASIMNHQYVGPVSWLDSDARPAEEIEIQVEIDSEHVAVRYPISPPRPNEPIICSSSLVIPITTKLRLGRAEASLSGQYVTYQTLLGLSAKLPESFVATFATADVDGYEAHLEISFDGSAVSGWFELSKGGTVPRISATFTAH
jgi:hypothetical protein